MRVGALRALERLGLLLVPCGIVVVVLAFFLNRDLGWMRAGLALTLVGAFLVAAVWLVSARRPSYRLSLVLLCAASSLTLTVDWRNRADTLYTVSLSLFGASALTGAVGASVHRLRRPRKL